MSQKDHFFCFFCGPYIPSLCVGASGTLQGPGLYHGRERSSRARGSDWMARGGLGREVTQEERILCPPPLSSTPSRGGVLCLGGACGMW